MKHFFDKKIQQIIVIFRDSKTRDSSSSLIQWFHNKNVKVKSFLQSSLDKKKLQHSADLILVLGGDGTYLSAVRFVQKKSIPMLGVNMGSLGFLTVHRKEQLLKCLEKTFQGKMIMNERPLMDVKSGDTSCLALNDVVIERGVTSQLIDISVYFSNRPIYSLKADGLIVSSATGSTAYNLAAGGPILHPTVKSFVVTPICPHSLTHRPVLFPDNHTLKFKIQTAVKGALLTVDGRRQSHLSKFSCVTIRKSKQVHQAIRDPQQCNFIYLKDKLKFFERSI